MKLYDAIDDLYCDELMLSPACEAIVGERSTPPPKWSPTATLTFAAASKVAYDDRMRPLEGLQRDAISFGPQEQGAATPPRPSHEVHLNLSRLLYDENQQRLPPTYYAQLQFGTRVTKHDRNEAAAWIHHVVRKVGLSFNTGFLALSLVDRVLARNDLNVRTPLPRLNPHLSSAFRSPNTPQV
jgi:hypothetical protein